MCFQKRSKVELITTICISPLNHPPVHSIQYDDVMTWKHCPHYRPFTLQWRHFEHDGVSIYQPHECSPSRLLRRRSKKTAKLRVAGLCAGNSPVTKICLHGSLVYSPPKRSIIWTFGVNFVVALNKLLNKLSNCWWYVTRRGSFNTTGHWWFLCC